MFKVIKNLGQFHKLPEEQRRFVFFSEGPNYYSTFYPVKEMLSPDHEEDVKEDRTPDLRTTLYWSPQTEIPSGKEDSITFYTSDIKGDYMVIVRGISAEGKIVQGQCEFKVE